MPLLLFAIAFCHAFTLIIDYFSAFSLFMLLSRCLLLSLPPFSFQKPLSSLSIIIIDYFHYAFLFLFRHLFDIVKRRCSDRR